MLFHLSLLADWQLPHHFAPILKSGKVGVYLFFVLSGFIIAKPFFQRPPSLRDYYLRRIVRIEPPFLICITFLAISQIIRGITPEDNMVSHFAATATYTHNLIFNEWSPINNVTWSLEAEILFYISGPFLIILLKLFPRKFRAIAIIALAAGWSYLVADPSSSHHRSQYGFIGAFAYFLTGIACAEIISHPDRRLSLPPMFASLLATFSAASVYMLIIFGVTSTFPYAMALGLFLFSCLHPSPVQRILSWKPATIIGGMCYTLYLYHFQIERLLLRTFEQTIGEPPYSPMLFAMFLVITIAIAIPLYLLFERPFMSLQMKRRSST